MYRCLYVLRRYSREEVLGRNCRFLQGQATSREAVATLRAAIRAQEKVTLELINYKRNGELFVSIGCSSCCSCITLLHNSWAGAAVPGLPCGQLYHMSAVWYLAAKTKKSTMLSCRLCTAFDSPEC